MTRVNSRGAHFVNCMAKKGSSDPDVERAGDSGVNAGQDVDEPMADRLTAETSSSGSSSAPSSPRNSVGEGGGAAPQIPVGSGGSEVTSSSSRPGGEGGVTPQTPFQIQ